MGKYQGIIDEAIVLPGNIAAIDFTDYDQATESFINQSNLAGAENAKVIGDSGFVTPLTTEDGVLLNGTDEQIRWLMTTQNVILRSGLLIFKMSEAFTGTLFECGDGLSGSFDFRAYSQADGRIQGDVGTGTGAIGESPVDTIQIGAICHVMVVNNGSSSKVYFGVDGVTNSEPIGEWNTVSGSSIYASLGATRNRFGFNKMEALFFGAWGTEIGEADLLSMLSQFGTYGFLTLATNLEASRIQSALALGPNREFNRSVSVPVGETDLAINISVEPGQLVEFFAFDSDEAKTNLTTGPVVPSPQEPLIFNPVAGSDGGEPGTGLIAHIAGTVDIDGTAAERQVIVISDDPNGRQVLGEGMSAPDGTFDIEYNDWGGAVIALAVDNYGGDWAAETAIASGTIIHPTTPNGYVYEAISGGTTGANEPTWGINGAVNDGSVTWSPRPFYRPVASGPIKGEILQEGVPQPIKYRFVRMTINSNNGDTDYTTINNFEIRESADGPDITDPAMGLVVSSTEPGFEFVNAIDSDPDNVWASDDGTFPITIRLDLGEPRIVHTLALRPNDGNAVVDPERSPKDFTIEVSNDDVEWTVAGDFTVTDWVFGTEQTFYLTSGDPVGGTPTEPEFKIIAIRLKDMYSQHPSQGYLNFSEIKLFDKDSNPIDLSGATATASSSHPNGTFPPYQAIDGDAGTSWFNENGVLPVTFEIQLLSATTISAIRIDAGSGDSFGTRAPSAFDIEVIEEGGSVWVLTDSYSGIDGNTTDGYYLGSQQDGVFTVTEPV